MTACTTIVVFITVVSVLTRAIPSDDFYPYMLDSNKQIISIDDASSRPIALNPPLYFYGRIYNESWVHNNGVFGFENYTEGFLEDPFPLKNYVLIAPFYGDVDTTSSGRVWYTDPITKDRDILERAKNDIREAFTEYSDFSPTYLLLSTWHKVGYFKERNDKLNTFQCVIATDGMMSFAIFLYNETQWTKWTNQTSISKQAKVGFNDGYQMKSWEMPCSRSQDVSYISYTSNIGVAGVWIFRIDQESIVPACPKNFKNECEGDALCSCLTRDFQQNCQCTNREYNITICTDPPEIGTFDDGRMVTATFVLSVVIYSCAIFLSIEAVVTMRQILLFAYDSFIFHISVIINVIVFITYKLLFVH